jgi:hypothetical protein
MADLTHVDVQAAQPPVHIQIFYMKIGSLAHFSP